MCVSCFVKLENCCMLPVPVMVTAVFPDIEKLSPHVQLSPERPQAPLHDIC